MILRFHTSSNIICGHNRVLQSHFPHLAAAVSGSSLECPFTVQVLKIQEKHNSSIKKSKTDQINLIEIQCKNFGIAVILKLNFKGAWSNLRDWLPQNSPPMCYQDLLTH